MRGGEDECSTVICPCGLARRFNGKQSRAALGLARRATNSAVGW